MDKKQVRQTLMKPTSQEKKTLERMVDYWVTFDGEKKKPDESEIETTDSDEADDEQEHREDSEDEECQPVNPIAEQSKFNDSDTSKEEC